MSASIVACGTLGWMQSAHPGNPACWGNDRPGVDWHSPASGAPPSMLDPPAPPADPPLPAPPVDPVDALVLVAITELVLLVPGPPPAPVEMPLIFPASSP